MDGKDTGIPGETELDEDVEGPERLARNGITGSAITPHGAAADILQNGFRFPGFLSKLVGALLKDQLMAISVGCNLMTSLMDIMYEIRIPLRYPPEDKKGCSDGVLIKQIQQSLRIGNHPGGPLIPILRANNVLEGGYVKIIFDIDGHGTGCRYCGHTLESFPLQ